VASAVPSAVVGEVKRPVMTFCPEVLSERSEKLLSSAISYVSGKLRNARVVIGVPVHESVKERRSPVSVRPPSLTSKTISSRRDVPPP
jgi:hypothetical protein